MILPPTQVLCLSTSIDFKTEIFISFAPEVDLRMHTIGSMLKIGSSNTPHKETHLRPYYVLLTSLIKSTITPYVYTECSLTHTQHIYINILW